MSAASTGLAALLICALSACLADWLLQFESRTTRLVLFASGNAFAIAAAALRFGQLRRSHRSLTAWALEMENHWPSLRGVLSAAADFLSAHGPGEAGSQELAGRVVETAANRLRAIPPRELKRLVDARPAWLSLAWLALAALAATTFGAWRPLEAATALERWAFPLSAQVWPRTTTLRWIDSELRPLDAGQLARRVAAGEPLTVSIDEARGRLPEDMLLWHRSPDGIETPVPIRQIVLQDPDGTPHPVASAMLVPSPGLHRLVASGGDDDRLPPLALQAESPPVIERFELEIRPPAYSQRPAERRTSSVAHIRGLVGSTVALTGTASAPLSTARAVFDTGESVAATLAPNGRELHVQFPLTHSGTIRFWIEAADQNHLSHPHPPRFDLIGDEDQVPSVVLEQPAEDLRMTEGAELSYRVTGRDDIGLNRARLELRRVEPAPGAGDEALHHHPLPVEGRLQTSATWTGAWSLANLGLAAGQSWELQAVVADSLPAEPATEREGRSAVRTIWIVPAEELLRRLAADEQSLADDLGAVRDGVARDLAELRETRAAWRSARQLEHSSLDRLHQWVDDVDAVGRRLNDPQGWRNRLGRLREAYALNHLSAADADRRLDSVEALVRQAGDDFQPQNATALRQAVRAFEAAAARQSDLNGSLAPRADEAAGIDDDLARAEAAQRQEEQALTAAYDQLARRARQSDARQILEKIIAAQHDLHDASISASGELLSKSAAETTAQDRGRVARLAERQRLVRDEVDRLRNSLAAERSDSGTTGAQSPAGPLDGAAATQVSDLMGRSATALDALNLGEALNAQRELDGLLSGLHDRLKSSPSDDDRLVKTLDDAEKFTRELSLQEGEWIATVNGLPQAPSSDGSRREMLDSLRQQQLQRSQQVDELAERLRQITPAAAQRLGQAAEDMRRSTEQLEDENLAAASDRAEQARRQLDETAAELQREQQAAATQQQLVRYQRLRSLAEALAARQSGLRDETARLEDLSHSEQQLTRSQRRTLHQLAEDQQALGRETLELGQSAPDDITRWALDSANRSMAAAAERLEQQDTGPATQQPQETARRRLKSIAESLVLTPPDAPTPGAQPNSGESAAEPGAPSWISPQLALLRELQIDLMERTRRRIAGEESVDDSQLQREQEQLSELGRQILSDVLQNDVATPEPEAVDVHP